MLKNIAILFIVVTAQIAHAQPGDLSYFGLETLNSAIAEDPNNHEARLKRSQLIFSEGAIDRSIEGIDMLNEMDYIISQNPTMDDSFWAKVYLLKGNCKTHYQNSFERGLDDYMMALRYSIGETENQLDMTIVQNTYFLNRDSRIDSLAKRIIREFVLYKDELFRNVGKNHYYYLFQDLVNLGNLFLEINQVEKAEEIANYLSALVPRDNVLNNFDTEKYLSVFELKCKIAVHNRNDAAFMQNFYLCVGAPYGQANEINQELLNYFNFSVEDKDYYWHICNAIMISKQGYYNPEHANRRNSIWKIMKAHLDSAQDADAPNSFYMTYFIKSIYEFEAVGDTHAAWNLIEKAIYLNPKDIYAQEFKLHIMFMDRNYRGKLEMINAEVLEAIESERVYCFRYQQSCAQQHPFLRINDDALINLRRWISFPQ